MVKHLAEIEIALTSHEIDVLIQVLNGYQGGLSYTIDQVNLTDLRDKLAKVL